MGTSVAPELDQDDLDKALAEIRSRGARDPMDLALEEIRKGPRGLRGSVQDVKEFVRHPIEAVRRMGEAVAEGLNKATAPIEGMPKGVVKNLVLRRPQERVTQENTPNAVTGGEALKGMGESAVNIAMALAPELGLPARAVTNAAAGALMNPEDRVRGAGTGLALGETIHGVVKGPAKLARAAGRVGDVSEGMFATAMRDFGRDVAAEQLHANTGMSPSRRPAPPPPVEPPANAEGVSFGETPARELGPAGKSAARWLDVPHKAIGEITRRPKLGGGAAVRATAESPHEYSSTQLDLPSETAAGIKQLASKIPDTDLAENGRETNPHITVKYGLHGNDPEKVRALLADEPPVTVKLGKTSIFTNGESGNGDVLKVDVDSPELHALNKKIADALPNTDTHPEYKPHATIAYLKPGLGEKYAGDESLAGHTVTLDHVTFSGKDGKTVDIPLKGATPGAAAIERRTEPRTDNTAWTPEQRAAHHEEEMRRYNAVERVSKPLSPAEMDEHFARGETEKFPYEQAMASELAKIRSAAKAPETAPETASYPKLEEHGLTPVASANTEFEVRPGVMRRVNRDEAALPSAMRLPPERTAADLASAQPEGVKRISPDEIRARNAVKSQNDTKLELGADQPKRVNKTADLFDEAREPSGGLRRFHRVSDDALLRELTDYQAKIVDAQQRSIYNYTPDENFHSTEDGRVVVSATRKNGEVSQQAKALQNLKDYSRIMDEIESELTRRGHTKGTMYERQQHLADLDAALERDAMEHANNENDADVAFDTGEPPIPRSAVPAAGESPKERPISDILNVAKLDLANRTAQERVAQQLEKYRSQREANRQTFAEADVNRSAIVKELVAGDGKALSPQIAKKLSGEELLARRDVVRQNDQMITDLSKAIESKTLSVADHEQAVQMMQKALDHNDALLSDLVTGSSQKGRDLNLLRRIANRSLDADVWQLQAKRLLGDKPLTDEISSTIRRLAKEAVDACGGG